MKKAWALVYIGFLVLAAYIAVYVYMHGVAMLIGLGPVFGGG